MKRDKILKILMIVSLLPYIGLLLYGVWCMIFGFTFFFETCYGIEAFFSSIIIGGLILWVDMIIPVCLIYQLFYIIYKMIRKRKNRKIKDDNGLEGD